jgi:hypothetical protein
MVVIPPKPWHPDPDNFDMVNEFDKLWKVQPVLIFRVYLKPKPQGHERYVREGWGRFKPFPLDLMFYSLFEPVDLQPSSALSKAGVELLYEPSPIPCLYVDFLDHAMGRVPLVPCFLDGSDHPTIPNAYSRFKNSKFPHGKADGLGRPGSGSRLFQVNHWLWRFGKVVKRDMSVEQAQELRKQLKEQRLQEQKK